MIQVEKGKVTIDGEYRDCMHEFGLVALTMRDMTLRSVEGIDGLTISKKLAMELVLEYAKGTIKSADEMGDYVEKTVDRTDYTTGKTN